MAKGNRYRVYEAEKKIPKQYFSSVEAAQGHLNWVCRTKWWKQHSTVKHINLKYPSFYMSGSWKLNDVLAEIECHAWSLDIGTVCHEQAHIIDWRPRTTSQEKCHDAQFAGVNLAVWKRYMGKSWADMLEKAYQEEGVKWIPYE
jgi:hypothetical protein